MAKKKNQNQKNYNAFKMWGSWSGAIVGFLLQSIDSVGCLDAFQKTTFGFDCNSPFSTYGLKALILIIVGFLIGWGIHSLIRKLKSNN